MAAFKALRHGETELFQDIQRRKGPDLAQCKGVALSDSSMEESERIHQKERNSKRPDGGRRSENSEEVDSIRSSKDFW
jgi:hypothetical protein